MQLEKLYWITQIIYQLQRSHIYWKYCVSKTYLKSVAIIKFTILGNGTKGSTENLSKIVTWSHNFKHELAGWGDCLLTLCQIWNLMIPILGWNCKFNSRFQTFSFTQNTLYLPLSLSILTHDFEAPYFSISTIFAHSLVWWFKVGVFVLHLVWEWTADLRVLWPGMAAVWWCHWWL